MWHTWRCDYYRITPSYSTVLDGDISGRTPIHSTDTQAYCVYLPNPSRTLECPVEGFQGWATNQMNLRIQLVKCHMWYMIVNMEEGNRTHPGWTGCNIFSPWKALNFHHFTMALRARGSEGKHQMLTAEEYQSGVEIAFRAYVCPFQKIKSFKKLECILMANNDECLVVVKNIWTARNKLEQLYRILRPEGGVRTDTGNNFKGSGSGCIDIWVVYLGDNPLHWQYSGEFPPQVRPLANKE